MTISQKRRDGIGDVRLDHRRELPQSTSLERLPHPNFLTVDDGMKIERRGSGQAVDDGVGCASANPLQYRGGIAGG